VPINVNTYEGNSLGFTDLFEVCPIPDSLGIHLLG
jgi:hypothetical protein